MSDTSRAVARLHPKEFGAAYDKARRSYGAAAAILLAWEVLGVVIETQPLTNVNITVKSADVAPFIIVAFIFYYGLRFTIEWHQSHPERRTLTASRIDLWLAHGIGFMALGVFIIQRISRIRVANFADAGFVAALMLGVFGIAGGVFLRDAALGAKRQPKMRPKTRALASVAGIVFLVPPVFFLISRADHHPRRIVADILLCAGGALATYWATDRFRVPAGSTFSETVFEGLDEISDIQLRTAGDWEKEQAGATASTTPAETVTDQDK